MTITVEYHGQARAIAGRSDEALHLDEGCTLRQVLTRLGERYGVRLREILLTADGRRHPSLLLFVGDRQVPVDADPSLRPDERLSILTPISGG